MGKRIVFWLLFIGGVYLIIVLARDLWEVLSSRERVEEAQKKVEILAKRKEELEQELKWVVTDEFVEREAREKLMLSRPGERTVLLPKTSSFSAESREEKVVAESLPAWKQWWKLFVY